MRTTALYVVVTLLFAYPISWGLGSRVMSSGPDTDLFVWSLAWNAHALATHPWALFDANMYFPAAHTLAYSESLLGSSLVAAPVIWVTGNAVLAMNLVVLSACVLSGLGTYLLARRLGLGAAAAVVAGLVFAFAPPRFFRLDQVHLATVQWMPFSLAFAHGYLDRGRRRDLWCAIGGFTMQALTSGHGAVFLAVALALLAVYEVGLGRFSRIAGAVRDAGVFGWLLLAPALALFVPYLQVQRETGLRRTLENTTVTPESFLASPSTVHGWLLSLASAAHINGKADAYLFPGFMVIALAGAAWLRRPGQSRGAPRAFRVRLTPARVLLAFGVSGLVGGACLLWTGPVRLRVAGLVLLSVRDPRPLMLIALASLVGSVMWIRRGAPPLADALVAGLSRWRRWGEQTDRSRRGFYFVVVIVAVLLAIGPPAGLWPLVYQLPGFSLIRVPSRFILLALLGGAVLAGHGVERVAAWTPLKFRVPLACALGALVLVEAAVVPLPTEAYGIEIPSVDRWLATVPRPFAVAEVPLANPRDLGAWERRHTAYLLHSTSHWEKTVHGYSGYRPPLHERLYEALTRFPDDVSLGQLEALGVTYVVVHTGDYQPEAFPGIETGLQAFADRLALVFSDSTGRVYRLTRSASR